MNVDIAAIGILGMRGGYEMGYKEYNEQMINVSQFLRDIDTLQNKELKNKYDFIHDSISFDSLMSNENYTIEEKNLLLAFNLGWKQRDLRFHLIDKEILINEIKQIINKYDKGI